MTPGPERSTRTLPAALPESEHKLLRAIDEFKRLKSTGPKLRSDVQLEVVIRKNPSTVVKKDLAKVTALGAVVDYLLLAVLALAIQTVVNHKYVGHFVMVLFFLFSEFMGQLGLEHNLYRYASDAGSPKINHPWPTSTWGRSRTSRRNARSASASLE